MKISLKLKIYFKIWKHQETCSNNTVIFGSVAKSLRLGERNVFVGVFVITLVEGGSFVFLGVSGQVLAGIQNFVDLVAEISPQFLSDDVRFWNGVFVDQIWGFEETVGEFRYFRFLGEDSFFHVLDVFGRSSWFLDALGTALFYELLLLLCEGLRVGK